MLIQAILVQVWSLTLYASRLLHYWLQPKPNPRYTPAAAQLTPRCPRLLAGTQSIPSLVADFLTPLPVWPLSSPLAVDAPMPRVMPQSSTRVAAFRPVPPIRPIWTRRKRAYGVR